MKVRGCEQPQPRGGLDNSPLLGTNSPNINRVSARQTGVPEAIGRFRVLKRIGAGGMAEVFLARSAGAEGLEKLLVLKRIHPHLATNSRFVTMFVDEANVAMRLNHPNIVQVYSFEQIQNSFVLAMEFVDGLDLGRLYSAAKQTANQVPPNLAAYVIMEVARGLDYAHNRKDERGHPLEIVHRDVSPQNIIVGYEGTVKIADFGIARARLVSEETGIIKGKFSYMAPEQARGQRVDARADVYALGIILAELLMERSMYPGLSGIDLLEEVRAGRVTQPGTVRAGLPKELEAIVERALAFAPEDRFPTARAMAGALGRYLHSVPDIVDGEVLERFVAAASPRDSASIEIDARGPLTEAGPLTLVSRPPVDKEWRERRQALVVSVLIQTDEADRLRLEIKELLENMAFRADAALQQLPDDTAPVGANMFRFRYVLGLAKTTLHDPLRAIRLALDLLDMVGAIADEKVGAVSASVGIARGYVSTWRDSSGRLLRYEAEEGVFGVSDALALAAGSDEVLVTSEVYRLTRRNYAFDEAAPQEVLPASRAGDTSGPALRAYGLLGARAFGSLAPVGMGPVTGDVLLGREEEISALVGACQELGGGAPTSSYVVVSGDVGVGKSALLDQLQASLSPYAQVFRANAAFGSAEVPFAHAGLLFRAVCGLSPELAPSQAFADAVRWMESHLPSGQREPVELAARVLFGVAGVDARDAAAVVSQGIRGLLKFAARGRPSVIMLDELQWSDTPSLELLSDFAQRGLNLPLLVIIAARPDERIERLLAGVTRLTLSELDLSARRQLLLRRLQVDEVPLDLERTLLDRTGGNPLFIVELVDALFEKGALRREEDPFGHLGIIRDSAVSMLVPSTMEDVFASRLADLGEAERRMLRWLAVAAVPLAESQLRVASGAEPQRQIAALVAKGFVTKAGDRYRFASQVGEQVVYLSIDRADRPRMHLRLAGVLRGDERVVAAQLARHLELGGDRTAASKAFLEAGEQAKSVHSHSEALRHFRKALSLMSARDPERFFAHDARENILRGLGRRADQSREILLMQGLADELGRPRLQAIAAARRARLLIDLGQLEQVDGDLLPKALSRAQLANDRATEVEVLWLKSQLARDRGDTAGALAAADRALERAGNRPDTLSMRGAVVMQRGILLRRLGRLTEAVEADAEAVVIFRVLGQRRSESQALNALGVALSAAGAYEDAIEVIRASILMDRTMGECFHVGTKLSNVGQLYAELGDAPRAESFLRRSLRVFAAIGDAKAKCDALCGLANVLIESGTPTDGGEAERLLDEAADSAFQRGDHYHIAQERIARGLLLRARGQGAQAAESYDAAIDSASAAGLLGFELLARAHLAEVAADAGRMSEARECARGVRADVQARGGAVERAERIQLSVSRALAAAGDDEGAAAAFADAYTVVKSRLESLRSPSVRNLYLQTPHVRAILHRSHE